MRESHAQCVRLGMSVKVSRCDTSGAVYEGYAHAGRPVGLPESAVTSGEFQNGVQKALVSC